MANIKSSIKRARQNVKLREQNRYFRTTARTYVKRTRTEINGNNLEDAAVALQLAIKSLDKAAQKRLIHPNNAARRKSRLVKAFNKAKAAT